MPAWLLPLAFIVVPLVEIWAIIQVGQVIGAWWTILLLILDSVIGAWLVKREGGRAWKALTTALGTGRMPAGELADGALVLIGGTLMLTPGFVTDALGFVLILPFTRPWARRLLSRVVASRLLVVPLSPSGGSTPGRDTPGSAGPGQSGGPHRPGPDDEPPVVRGEVIDD